MRSWTLALTMGALAMVGCSTGDDGLEKDRDAGQVVRDSGSTPRDGGDTTVRDGGANRDGGDTTPRDGGMRDAGEQSPVGLDNRPTNTTCIAPAPPNNARVQIQTTRVFQSAGAFSRPIFATQEPDDDTKWYVVEQSGTVRVFDNVANPGTATTFIDLTGTVDDGPNEAGLLGMAFHPDYANNGYVYLSYTTGGGGLRSRIVRYTRNTGGATLNPATAFEIFSVAQPYGNHNGGNIAFGPGGYLFIGFGDGGSGGDPQGNGQNINTVLGSIIRLDVDGGSPYAIPPTNPFYQINGADEIYAYGLRNPWRFSFDRLTGELWVGDVGQNALEEVDIVELGGNYGWNIREGDRCYQNPCDPSGLIDPVAVYPRSDGVSITGGYVYRGSTIPGLEGVYLYADFSSGRMWGLFENPQTGEKEDEVLLNTGFNVASFAQGNDGELYLVTFDGGMQRIELNGNPPADPFPQLLSETGCVDPNDPRMPAAGLVPYDVNAPLWSDGAEKQRWLAIPDGETITVDANGDFDLPNGSVLMKNFRVNNQLVETRLFMRHLTGQWAGYTYGWNAQQTEATLLASSVRVDVGGTSWRIPSRGECMTCHTAVSGRSLGLEVAQLNRDFAYAATGRTANQLETLSGIGMLTDAIADVTALPALPAYQAAVPVQDRVRGYLHANCSNCHRMGGPAQGQLDLRFDTPLATTGLCDAPMAGSFGIPNALVVTPQQVSQSILPYRMSTLEAPRMPPLGSEVVDPVGTQIVNEWIGALPSCP